MMGKKLRKTNKGEIPIPVFEQAASVMHAGKSGGSSSLELTNNVLTVFINTTKGLSDQVRMGYANTQKNFHR